MEGFLQKTVSYNIFISQNIPNMEIKKRIQATHLVIMATDKLVPDRFGWETSKLMSVLKINLIS